MLECKILEAGLFVQPIMHNKREAQRMKLLLQGTHINICGNQLGGCTRVLSNGASAQKETFMDRVNSLWTFWENGLTQAYILMNLM